MTGEMHVSYKYDNMISAYWNLGLADIFECYLYAFGFHWNWFCPILLTFRLSLCALYLLVCLIRVSAGDSGLCCFYLTSFER